MQLHIYVFINVSAQVQNATRFLVHSATCSTVVMCTVCPNSKAVHVLPTLCICVSRKAVKTNSDYFPIEQLLVDLHSDEAMKYDVFTAILFSVLVF